MDGRTGPESGGQAPLSQKGTALLDALESSRDLIARQLVRDLHAIPDHDLNYLAVTPLLQVLFLKAGQECGLADPGTLAALGGCDRIAQRMARACSDAGLDPELFFENGPAGGRALPPVPDEPVRAAIALLENAGIPAPVTGLPPEELAAVLEHFVAVRLRTGEGYRVVRDAKSALLYTGCVDVPPSGLAGLVARRAARSENEAPASGTPREIRILDPACGAGLFLLAAFRTLVRDHGRYGRELTCDGLQEILRSSVFGTDIDDGSVSAARLVLLLAFTEECRNAGAGMPGPDRIAAACRSLEETIRCGNALIAPDYFLGKPVFPFNAEERRRVNAFDWQAAFPAVMAGGGFDTVIGAPPPYRPFAVKAREEYFQTHYDGYAASAGLYGYFIERGLSLLRPGGLLAFLVPGTFLRSEAARPLRRLLLSRQIRQIACTKRTRALPEGNIPVYLVELENRQPQDPFTVSPDLSSGRHGFRLDQRSLDDGGWRLEDTRAMKILEKVRAQGTLLEEYVMGEMGTGVVDARDNPLIVDRKTRNRLTKNAWGARRFFLPLLGPADLRRYLPEKPSRFVIAEAESEKIRKYRELSEYLEGVRGKECSGDNRDSSHGVQEDLHEPVTGPAVTPRPLKKIMFPLHAEIPVFSIDPAGSCAITNAVGAIHRNDPFLVAILNSTLGRFILVHICPYTERNYSMNPAALGKFPVIVPDFEKYSGKKIFEKIVSLVTHMLELNRYLPQAKTGQERRLVQQEIDATDVRIDALVYELYGLTPEEIQVVEGSSPS